MCLPLVRRCKQTSDASGPFFVSQQIEAIHDCVLLTRVWFELKRFVILILKIIIISRHVFRSYSPATSRCPLLLVGSVLCGTRPRRSLGRPESKGHTLLFGRFRAHYKMHRPVRGRRQYGPGLVPGGGDFARGEFRGENVAVKKGGEIFPWPNFGSTVPSFIIAEP